MSEIIKPPPTLKAEHRVFYIPKTARKRADDPSQEVKMPDVENYTALPADPTFENPGPEAAR